MRYSEKWPVYAAQWDKMVIKPDRAKEFELDARYAIVHKAQYQAVEAATGVPWPMIAVLHRREGAANFNTYLGNGQSLAHKTTEVPIGRGPFKDFLSGAIDAIKVEGWGNITDWRLEKMLYYEELFNGTGYAARDLPSPYIWGGTNIQRPGKFVADHDFRYGRMDPQPGTAPMMWMIAKLDPTVKYVRET